MKRKVSICMGIQSAKRMYLEGVLKSNGSVLSVLRPIHILCDYSDPHLYLWYGLPCSAEFYAQSFRLPSIFQR